MARLRYAIAFALAALLASTPLAAVKFTVYLTNGTTFESRYQPKDASWDAEKIVFLDETGNPISLAKSEVERVESDVDAAGFGHMLDNTTMAFGWAPNDLSEEAGTAARERYATAAAAAPASTEPIYNVNQAPVVPLYITTQAQPGSAAAPPPPAPTP